LAFQEPAIWPFRNFLFGLSGTKASTFLKKIKYLGSLSTSVTRARDLNKNLTLLTHSQTHRLKRGLRPLGASIPPNPPYPHKERPTGQSRNFKHYRPAALRTAGK